MHSPDKIQQFFDLRSRGNCLSYISRTIDVPISTLSDWNRRHALDIDTARACKWEGAEQAAKFNTEADLVRVIQRMDAFEHELDRRSPDRMSVGELVRVISLWRREYFRRRDSLLRSIEHPAPIPESESEMHSVTPDVRRGLTSHDPSENTTTSSATAAREPTNQPEPETNRKKPEFRNLTLPLSHLLTRRLHPARAISPLSTLNSQLSTPGSRQPTVSDNGVSTKTNIASPP